MINDPDHKTISDKHSINYKSDLFADPSKTDDLGKVNRTLLRGESGR